MSIAAHFRPNWIFYANFIANFLLHMVTILRTVGIWQNCRQAYNSVVWVVVSAGSFLGHAVDEGKWVTELTVSVCRLTSLTFCAASSRASETFTRCCTRVPWSLDSWSPRFQSNVSFIHRRNSLILFYVPSVLRCCLLGVRMGIRPKKWVMKCCCGYLSGVRCRLFAYDPADATASLRPRHLLPRLNPDWFYLSGTG